MQKNSKLTEAVKMSTEVAIGMFHTQIEELSNLQ